MLTSDEEHFLSVHDRLPDFIHGGGSMQTFDTIWRP